jgi:hypothetical protein
MENQEVATEVKKEMSLTILQDLMPLCEVFVKSGIFEDTKDVAQAVVKVLAGREMGLTALESMMGLYLVKGKIAASSKVICALIKKSQKYDYRVTKLDSEECSIEFLKFGADGKEEIIGISTFTIKDAARAGVVNGVNWKGYPRNMLFARAITNGARWYCPDVYSGSSEEELEGVMVDVKKDVVTMDAAGEVTNGEKKIS